MMGELLFSLYPSEDKCEFHTPGQSAMQERATKPTHVVTCTSASRTNSLHHTVAELTSIPHSQIGGAQPFYEESKKIQSLHFSTVTLTPYN